MVSTLNATVCIPNNHRENFQLSMDFNVFIELDYTRERNQARLWIRHLCSHVISSDVAVNPFSLLFVMSANAQRAAATMSTAGRLSVT